MNQVQDVIQLDKNENPLGCSDGVIAAINQQLQPHRYPQSKPIELIEKISEMNHIAPEQVILGNGSDELLFIIARHYLRDSKQVIIPKSSFEGFDFAASQCAQGVDNTQVQVVKTPLTDYGIDLAAINQAINQNTALIFLANPNNPTGTLLSIDQIASWLETLPSHIMVVIDEAYIEFAMLDCYQHVAELLGRFPQVIFTRTFSKIYGLPALRIGYCMANEAVINIIRSYKAPFNINSAAQIAAQLALADTDHLKASFDHAMAQKQRFYQRIEQLGGRYVESYTNFVLVKFDVSIKDMHQFLCNNGVFTKYFIDEQQVDFLRVTLGSEQELTMLYHRIEQFLTLIHK